jgi:hypothetical protein
MRPYAVGECSWQSVDNEAFSHVVPTVELKSLTPVRRTNGINLHYYWYYITSQRLTLTRISQNGLPMAN